MRRSNASRSSLGEAAAIITPPDKRNIRGNDVPLIYIYASFLNFPFLPRNGFQDCAGLYRSDAAAGAVEDAVGKALIIILLYKKTQRNLSRVIRAVRIPAQRLCGGFEPLRHRICAAELTADPGAQNRYAGRCKSVFGASGICPQKASRTEQYASEVSCHHAHNAGDLFLPEHLKHGNAGSPLRLAVIGIAFGAVSYDITPAVVPGVIIFFLNLRYEGPCLFLGFHRHDLPDEAGALFLVLGLPRAGGHVEITHPPTPRAARYSPGYKPSPVRTDPDARRLPCKRSCPGIRSV